MSYAIFRTDKMKSTVLDKCQRHNQRENKSYSNKDIDLFKSKFNYELHNSQNINYREEINKKIKERYKGKKAIRKDAILNIECLITSDTDFFNRIGEYDTERYFKEAYEFVKKEFGEENINYATVHMDETTPHMHLGVTPLTKDGRLSAKNWLDGKKKLTEMQNRFYKHIKSKGFELERGISSDETNAKNKRIKELKKDSQRELDILKEQIEEAKRELDTMSNIFFKDTLSSYEVDNISYDNVSTLFGGIDYNYVKIKKSDFDNLKKMASNVSEKYELYKSSIDRVDFLENSNKELRQANEELTKEKDFYKNSYSSLVKRYNKQLEELKDNHKIDTLRKDLLIKDMTQFLRENQMYIDFQIFKENKFNKRIDLAEQKNINRNQNQKELKEIDSVIKFLNKDNGLSL